MSHLTKRTSERVIVLLGEGLAAGCSAIAKVTRAAMPSELLDQPLLLSVQWSEGD